MQFSMEKLTGAMVALTLIGVCVGFEALSEYKRANMEAVNARMTQMDRDIYNLHINNDKFNAIFAYLPDGSSADEVRKNSRKLLGLSVDSRVRDEIPEIKDIEGLYDLIWGADDFDDKSFKTELRSASTHADLIFYMVAEAHSAFVAGLMNESDYKAWAAYVLDVGTHPLFLVSIYNAHEIGYVNRDFAYEIREILMKNNRTSIVVKTLYPDMYTDKKWADKVGAKYIKKHTPTKYVR